MHIYLEDKSSLRSEPHVNMHEVAQIQHSELL